MEEDISGLDLSAYDVAAVNRSGVRYLGAIRWWVSYHPSHMVKESWAQRRVASGGNRDFSIVLHHRHRWCEKMGWPVVHFAGPSQTGSSTLLAVLFGLQSEQYDAVLVAGAPLVGKYATFHDGWIQAKHILGGRVESMSGWTKTYLEGLNAR